MSSRDSDLDDPPRTLDDLRNKLEELKSALRLAKFRLNGLRTRRPRPVGLDPKPVDPEQIASANQQVQKLQKEIAAVEQRIEQLENGRPVVYVRGFAGGTKGIDRAVDDPFYGFNGGSTHIRIGGNNDPQYFQFESPLLRLMTDEGYEIFVEGDQERYLREHDAIPAKTIWVYRFYDAAASTFGHAPDPFTIEGAAEGLYNFIQLVREKTGADKVFLVAHSMGGLICRSMLQQASYRTNPDGTSRTPGEQLVDKLFTYGTPHGGITSRLGQHVTDWAKSLPLANGADIFTPKRMYGYLKRGASGKAKPRATTWKPNASEGFPADRIFCLIGTNAADYGPARHLIGPQSDGLVETKNAYVEDAHRAYVHRSHTGRYGMVNSEEGYQNLRRFLFGSHRIGVALVGLEPLKPQASGGIRFVWQAELEVSVRGLPVVMHQQLTDHYCPIQLSDALTEARKAGLDRVALTTVFLRSAVIPEGDDSAPFSRFALHFRVIRLEERHGRLLQRNNLVHAADFDDVLIVDIETAPNRDLNAWAAWRSEIVGATADKNPITEVPLEPSEGGYIIALPRAGASLLTGARLVLTLGLWE